MMAVAGDVYFVSLFPSSPFSFRFLTKKDKSLRETVPDGKMQMKPTAREALENRA
jgi:hypothetical protein